MGLQTDLNRTKIHHQLQARLLQVQFDDLSIQPDPRPTGHLKPLDPKIQAPPPPILHHQPPHRPVHPPNLQSAPNLGQHFRPEHSRHS